MKKTLIGLLLLLCVSAHGQLVERCSSIYERTVCQTGHYFVLRTWANENFTDRAISEQEGLKFFTESAKLQTIRNYQERLDSCFWLASNYDHMDKGMKKYCDEAANWLLRNSGPNAPDDAARWLHIHTNK